MIGFDGPPFEFVAERLVEDADIRDELKAVSTIPQDRFDALSKAIVTYPTFLDRATLAEIVAKELPAADAKQITKVITRMNRIFRDSSDSVEGGLKVFENVISKRSDDFPNPKLIASRLRELIALPAGLAKQKKAEVLADATEDEIGDISIVCDIRPIFDEERAQIDGVIAVTIMRFELIGPGGLVSAVECRLTEKQLDRLCKISDAARRKLSAIREFASAKNIAMAKTSFDDGKSK